MPAKPTKVERQPQAVTEAASGSVAARLPALAKANRVAMAPAKRARGYQRASMTSEPTISPAQPTPISTRPAMRPDNVSAAAKQSDPAIASSIRHDMIRRAPKRSSSTPSGICITAKTKKNELESTPISSALIARSDIRLGAITAFDERKNWLRMTSGVTAKRIQRVRRAVVSGVGLSCLNGRPDVS